MKRKISIILCLCFWLPMLMFSNALAQEPVPGTQTIVDTIKDPKGKLNGRYDPNYSLYCSAVLITPNTWLTAKHCAGNEKKTGYIGAVYPGQSGASTPFGMMNISTYLPDASVDIAIIKGKDEDKSGDYKYYIKGFKTDIVAYSLDELKGLKGQAVYSYGYPGDKGETKQYRSDGIITNVNPITKEISTTMPASPGQSGSGVFLGDGRFLGILYGNETTQGFKSAKVQAIDQRLKTWIDNNKE
ncbi:trypsin-like serine peptidase [Staphylococcus delphini]|uniref:trypsin-like serine peptidase n=1 Tax=Staphylococcus delphini TaxID=53344 RepID=UPI000BBBE9BE|nr:serine protease [Staphylococcus delphini]PCF48095.1 serine protease [Staphylococcus delphini]PCF72445.1 serine protease [Staphylococcus delphini]